MYLRCFSDTGVIPRQVKLVYVSHFRKIRRKRVRKELELEATLERLKRGVSKVSNVFTRMLRQTRAAIG